MAFQRSKYIFMYFELLKENRHFTQSQAIVVIMFKNYNNFELALVQQVYFVSSIT